MDEIHRVDLLGFAAFERSTLEASFRLASTRRPAYELIDAAERARALVVDSDDASACAHSASQMHRCVHIGQEGRVGELGHLKRPINTTSLLRLLDACVEHAPPRRHRRPSSRRRRPCGAWTRRWWSTPMNRACAS